MAKYPLIKTTLKDRLLGGDYSEGFPLPSEPQLAREFEVSRMTARRAIDDIDVGTERLRQQHHSAETLRRRAIRCERRGRALAAAADDDEAEHHHHYEADPQQPSTRTRHTRALSVAATTCSAHARKRWFSCGPVASLPYHARSNKSVAEANGADWSGIIRARSQ